MKNISLILFLLSFPLYLFGMVWESDYKIVVPQQNPRRKINISLIEIACAVKKLASAIGCKEALTCLTGYKQFNFQKKDWSGKTLMEQTVLNKDDDVLRILLGFGADPNEKNKNNRSLLHCALNTGDESVVSTLLDAGANITDTDILGRTPVFRAVVECIPGAYKKQKSEDLFNRSGHPKILRLLLKSGADPDTCTPQQTQLYGKEFKRTRLIHWAALNKNSAIISTLIDYNVDINAQDDRGKTALHFAVQLDNIENATKLLHAGACTEIKDNNQLTAFDYAAGNIEMLYLLLMHRLRSVAAIF